MLQPEVVWQFVIRDGQKVGTVGGFNHQTANSSNAQAEHCQPAGDVSARLAERGLC